MLSEAEVTHLAERLTGERYRFVASFAQGGGGVYCVEDLATRRRYVLKRRSASVKTLEQLRTNLRWADVLRSHGWPMSEVVAAGRFGGNVVSIEVAVDGQHPDAITPSILQTMLSLPALTRGAGIPVPQWFSLLMEQLDPGLDDGRGPIRPSVLAQHPVGREVLKSAEASYRRIPADVVVGDVVHGDFSPGNVVVQRGELQRVIDWDDARPGDACFDLSALEWDIAMWGRSVGHLLPQITARLEDESRPEMLNFYRAYWAGWNLSWAIGTTDESTVVDTWRSLQSGS